jgi:hypothetical protein
MNSAHRDEDCEECEEEAKEMTDEQETEFINKVELDTPNGVESQW